MRLVKYEFKMAEGIHREMLLQKLSFIDSTELLDLQDAAYSH